MQKEKRKKYLEEILEEQMQFTNKMNFKTQKGAFDQFSPEKMCSLLSKVLFGSEEQVSRSY